jgi:flagellar hook-associated protein 2
MKATSSDPSIVASTTGSPISGQWSVSVSSIAQSQRTLSNGMASPTTALGLSGTLAITVGSGQAKDISLLSTDTMADVANKISSAGLRAQTSLMYDGSQYHLLVAGLDTGAANSVAFDEAGLTGTGYTLGLSTAQNTIRQAQDASSRARPIRFPTQFPGSHSRSRSRRPPRRPLTSRATRPLSRSKCRLSSRLTTPS